MIYTIQMERKDDFTRKELYMIRKDSGNHDDHNDGDD